MYREVEWENRHKLLLGKVETRTKRINQASNEIYQLVGLCSVFVGVVYTAVVQSTHLKCQHIWSPIVLCLLACLVIFTVTIKKFREINNNLLTREENDSFPSTKKLEGVETRRGFRIQLFEVRGEFSQPRGSACREELDPCCLLFQS